jgi:hypothetical protein
METQEVEKKPTKPKTINVKVLTSSGSYPKHGHEKVPLTEALSEILARAAAALQIVDTARWVVSVNGKDVPATATYAGLGLHGEVKLDWGPAEGGGGA